LSTGKDLSKREKSMERCEKTGVITPIFNKWILSQIAKGISSKVDVLDSSTMGVKGVGGVEMVGLMFRKLFSH
jgi:hypothetical protein